MAITFRNDAQARRKKAKFCTLKTVGHKNSRLSFPFATLFTFNAVVTPNISCGNNPTARSEKARLRNNFFKVADIDEAFHKAQITRRFPRIAKRENTRFNPEKVNIKLL